VFNFIRGKSPCAFEMRLFQNSNTLHNSRWCYGNKPVNVHLVRALPLVEYAHSERIVVSREALNRRTRLYKPLPPHKHLSLPKFVMGKKQYVSSEHSKKGKKSLLKKVLKKRTGEVSKEMCQSF
jgi:hypothetical protein